MPSRNISKPDLPNTYYHVYARGASKQDIFLESSDYEYFLRLFKRYLSKEPSISKAGVIYPHYRHGIDLTTYCVMSNHFHLLVFQREQGTMKKLMQSVMTSYGRYFNLKYKRSGSPYESTYKAARITDDSYLMHISRYIHLNPRYWRRYPASSICYYLGKEPPEWLQPGAITDLFPTPDHYKAFLEEYGDQKAAIDEIKHQLADT